MGLMPQVDAVNIVDSDELLSAFLGLKATLL
jgi:hypothetical protein